MYENLPNKDLMDLSLKLGKDSLEAKRKFAGTLPEIQRRRLYAPKFKSILHFAKVVGGLTEEHVRRVLNLEKDYKKGKPTLYRMLVEGKASVHKLRVVKTIATTKNEAELAEQVSVLSKNALETWVKDMKMGHDALSHIQGENSEESGPGAINSEQCDEDVKRQPENSIQTKLMSHLSTELQKNLLKRAKKGININELLTDLLEQHDLELAQQKEKMAAEEEVARPKSRYIPAKVKKIIKREHGTKCSIPRCQKSMEHLHHTQRWAMHKSHDPRYIAPLCKSHHQIAHTIDRKYLQKKPPL